MNKLVREVEVGGGKLQVVHGDLTEEKVDAIVNAANTHLAHGGGVAGAIVRKGGKIIQDESDKVSPVPTGKAAATGAGSLPAKMVIHAVGPIFRNKGDENDLLRSAVWSSLEIGHEKDIETISMPAISSGIYGFPKERCAEILVQTALDFFEKYPDSTLKTVRFCNFDQLTVSIFENEFNKRF